METSPAPQRRATTSTARRTIPQCRIIDAFNYCAVDDSGALSYARSLPPSSLRRSHHDDLLHLDKEINYEWYAEALVKSLNCIEKFNPEDEEEFKDYFPAYIDMLHEVDEINDCLECSYSSLDDLFEKLKPEFVSRHAIDSASHDYVWTMSDMLSRKMSAKHWQRYNDQMHKFICELINLKPHIQHSTYDESLVDFVQNLDVCPDLDKFSKAAALEGFCTILSLWEPQFHPLIREGHKDVLTEMIHHSFYVENITHLQPLRPDLSDFPVHLRPRALNHIDDNNKLYHMAKDQARLHEDFDTHLSSGAFDDYICKGDALNAVCDAGIIDSQFPDLDHSLIELSFERRGKLLAMRERLHSYHKHLRDVVGNEQLRIELQSLMCELEAEGFFNVDDDSIDWDKKCFSQLMDKFDKQVFTGLGLPKYYVARGIMDYRAMALIKDDSRSWDEVFEKVVDEPYHRWIQNIPLYWMDTRYYKHQYYGIIQQPLQKLWKSLSRVDAPLDLEATIDKIKATTASLSSLRQGHNP